MTGKRGPQEIATVVAWWMVAFAVNLATYQFLNDHFGRISAARQIARYGEFPFRDFLDPGYVLTEFWSAGLQLVFGDNLLGEMLWTSAAIATGAVLVITLSRRLVPSVTSTIVIAVVVILAIPRAYDFDKALFYPLGILLCWRYVDRPSTARRWLLAGCAIVAGMFRYDNGLFMLAGGLIAVLTLHAHDLKMLRRETARLIGATAICALPYLVFLQWNGGIVNATNQMLTYARWEGGGTRLTELPTPVPAELRLVYEPDRVQVRWAPSADAERSRLEARYKLHGGRAQGNPANGVWLYEAEDTSSNNLRALINDPQVLDTHLIDRVTGELMRDGSRWQQLYRRTPLIGFWTVSWTSRDAANSLYWVFLLLPAGAVVIAWRRRTADRVELAKVLGAATMAACVVIVILRHPLLARMSGAAAPTLILGAWLWRHVHRWWTARIIAVAIVATSAVVTGWSRTVERLSENRLRNVISDVTVSPPQRLLPTPYLSALVDYLRRCTASDDRVFAGGFTPELYFFSQRAFAGGVSAIYGGHWSDRGYQGRIITKLESESVPVVIFPIDRNDLPETHAQLYAYFQAHYHRAGSIVSDSSGLPEHDVLVHNDRAPTGTDLASALPCFAKAMK